MSERFVQKARSLNFHVISLLFHIVFIFDGMCMCVSVSICALSLLKEPEGQNELHAGLNFCAPHGQEASSALSDLNLISI